MKNKNHKKFGFYKKQSVIQLGLILFLFLVIFFILYSKTGFFSMEKIDKKDLSYWARDKNEIIVGAEEIIFEGNKTNCWLMIHGYSSTPYDLKYLGENINKTFNDFVYIPRLKGHGELPSHLLNLTLEDWYFQVEEDFLLLKKECKTINLVGFSFGGALATKLSEEKEIKNTYLISPYFFPRSNFIKILDLNFYINLFADQIIYLRKSKIAQINSKELSGEYISYWNFVLIPIKNSKLFLEKTSQDVYKINTPILIQHSKLDDTADVLASKIIFEKISSKNKKLILFENSNHVVLFDYDRREAIKNIIDFENINR